MRSWVVCLCLLCVMPIAAATCHGRFINPVTDVCWSCLFPLSLGSATLASTHAPDTKNPSNPVCLCKTDNAPQVGLAVGFWEPMYLVDVTRTPYCFPTLGGLQLPHVLPTSEGTVSETATDSYSSYHVHLLHFPLLSLLGMLTDGACAEPPDVTVLLLSELDPTWQSDALATFAHPEALAVANPVMQATCSLDCLKANVGLPLNHLFWCQGCQGSLYPFTGHVGARTSDMQSGSLVVGRMLAKLHRTGLLWRASGHTNEAICQKTIAPFIPKNTYRLSMVYPRPATGEYGCLPLGRSTTLIEGGRTYPVTGEDMGYIVWRKRNCCSY